MAVGIPGALLADIVDGLVSTAERFECDAHKARIRAACGCRTRASRADDALGALTDGTGYFCGE